MLLAKTLAALAALAAASLAVASPLPGSGGTPAPPCPYTRPPTVLAAVNPLAPTDISFENLFTVRSNGKLLVGSNKGLYASGDNGASWQVLTEKGENYWGAIYTSKGTYLASHPNALLRFTNAGKTATTINLTAPGLTYPLTSTAYNMFHEYSYTDMAGKPATQIVWGTQNGLFVSIDDGLTWKPVNCAALAALSGGNLNDCNYLFTRTLLRDPAHPSLVAGFSQVGLYGLYGIALPVPTDGKSNITVTPVLAAGKAMCDISITDGLCSGLSSMTLFKGDLYAGETSTLYRIAQGVPTPVLNVAYAGNLQSVVASDDGNVLLAVADAGILTSTDGLHWSAPANSSCSTLAPYPSLPKQSFGRGAAGAGATASPRSASFLFGTVHGDYLLKVAY